MKKYIIIIGVLVGTIFCCAQTVDDKNFNKSDFISQFGAYFENVEINETGVIQLQAKGYYASLSAEKKSTIMELVLQNRFLCSVSYNNKQELWQKDSQSGKVNIVDNWDLNMLYTPKTTTSKAIQTTSVHPWFCSFGLGGSFNSDMISVNFTSGIGFFLLANRWNLAFNDVFVIDDNNMSAQIGLSTKVFFPIKKIKLSPYIGLGISYIWNLPLDDTYNEITNEYEPISATTTWQIPIYLGISWYIGPGSVDIGGQIGKNTVLMLGYTFSPSALIK